MSYGYRTLTMWLGVMQWREIRSTQTSAVSNIYLSRNIVVFRIMGALDVEPAVCICISFERLYFLVCKLLVNTPGKKDM